MNEHVCTTLSSAVVPQSRKHRDLSLSFRDRSPNSFNRTAPRRVLNDNNFVENAVGRVDSVTNLYVAWTEHLSTDRSAVRNVSARLINVDDQLFLADDSSSIIAGTRDHSRGRSLSSRCVEIPIDLGFIGMAIVIDYDRKYRCLVFTLSSWCTMTRHIFVYYKVFRESHEKVSIERS